MSSWRVYRRWLAALCWIGSAVVMASNTVNYNARNGICSNGVRKVFIDHTNRIWLGTDNGVSMISSNGITNYVYSKGLKCNKVWAIAECADKSLWFGSYGEGLYKFKDGRFINYPLPGMKRNNFIRKMISFKNFLFIGSEDKLNVFDYKKGKFINFKCLDQPKEFKIMDFFVHKEKLYIQSYFQGTFVADCEKRTIRKVRFIPEENGDNFSAHMNNGMLYLCHSTFRLGDTHQLLRIPMDSYLKGGKPDSLGLVSVAWGMDHDKRGKLYAACWGVTRDNGGLFRSEKDDMVSVNQELGINSINLWDVCYDQMTDKLYVATLDKGLYVADLSGIVQRTQWKGCDNVIDIVIAENMVFVMTGDKLLRVRNGRVDAVLTQREVDSYLLGIQKKEGVKQVSVKVPFYFREMEAGRDGKSLAVVTTHGAMRMDLDLKLNGFADCSGELHLASLRNQDILLSRTYDATMLFENFGKGRVFRYFIENSENPRDVTQSCSLNDSVCLVGSYVQKLYLFKHHKLRFKCFTELGDVKLPVFVDRLAENRVMMLDRSNVLYSGILHNDTLLMTRQLDLKIAGVVESYFMKVLNGITVLGTNKGVFLKYKEKLYLVDKSLGFPENAVLRTAQYNDGKIYVATSEGVFTIDINKLKSMPVSYELSNLAMEADVGNQSYQPGEVLILKKLPKVMMLKWEINGYPYPEKLRYYYSLNGENGWREIFSPGEIRIDNMGYGTTTVWLRVLDEVHNNMKEIKLVSIGIERPVYLQLWFILLGVALMVYVTLLFFYRIRIKRLKKKARISMEVARTAQLKLDTLQFLLKPHFIFNALTSIQNLILRNEMDKSLDYCGFFAKFLRGIMQNSGEELISLQEELRNISNYMELEKLRFNNEIGVVIDVAEEVDANQVKVIPFLFQPLVENMFKHAFTKEVFNPQITISISMQEQLVVYLIADNGVGLQGMTMETIIAKSGSKGLKIIRAQLEKFYGTNYRFNLSEENRQGVEWVICTPF